MLKRKAEESERAVVVGGLKKTKPTSFCFDGGGSEPRGAGFQFVSLCVTAGKNVPVFWKLPVIHFSSFTAKNDL